MVLFSSLSVGQRQLGCEISEISLATLRGLLQCLALKVENLSNPEDFIAVAYAGGERTAVSGSKGET